MSSIVINKKDVERFGRKIIKEVYDYFNSDYSHVINFDEFPETQKKFKNDIICNLFGNSHLKFKSLPEEFKFEQTKDLDKDKFEKKYEYAVKQINDEKMNIDVIFKILSDTEIDFDINGDLYDEKKAFLYIYNVFDYYHRYL